jgi:hypothetical protein
VVGVQVMVNGWPAVISSPSSGWPIGFPDGSLPDAVNCADEMANKAARALVVEKRILMCLRVTIMNE